MVNLMYQSIPGGKVSWYLMD